MEAIKYRGSEIQDFLRCRKKWDWRWNQGYTPKRQNDKLFFGNLFHKYLETLYRTGWQDDAIDAAIKFYHETSVGQDPVECDRIWDMYCQVSEGYMKKWWENDKEWKVIATEFEFEVPLDDEITYTGTIDLMFEYKGKVWFMDHKTTSSLDIYENNSRMDRQISRYWWALKKLGYDVGGFVYNIILKDFPTEPNVLKKGNLSTAKNQNTTYELYMKKIEELELNPLDYAEFLSYLQAHPREYFRRVNVKRTDAELANSMFEFYNAALEATALKRSKEKNFIYRNITKDCSWDCPFMDACKADMDGSNIEFLMNMAFNKEEKE